MHISEFVANVERIAGTNPTYRTGGSGKDGTCDCIGLIMGALGGKYDLHSSNYFARCQMRTLDSLVDESQLHAGSIVYKSRRDTAQLNARYQAGGRYYNGDLLDYYHVGVVTAIEPLTITHCTSTNSINGIALDHSIKAWSHAGDLLAVELGEQQKQEKSVQKVVTTQNDKPVNVRVRPDKNSPKAGEVNTGETVTVTETADGWAKIRHGNLTGYMMEAFLTTAPNAGEMVNIAVSRETAEELHRVLGQILGG